MREILLLFFLCDFNIVFNLEPIKDVILHCTIGIDKTCYDLLAISMIWLRQRPNSWMIRPSISTSAWPFRSASSACASKHWQVASTTSLVTKLKGCLTPETGRKAFPDTALNELNFDLMPDDSIRLTPLLKLLMLLSSLITVPCWSLSGFRTYPTSIFLQPMHRQFLVQAIFAS